MFKRIKRVLNKSTGYQFMFPLAKVGDTITMFNREIIVSTVLHELLFMFKVIFSVVPLITFRIVQSLLMESGSSLGVQLSVSIFSILLGFIIGDGIVLGILEVILRLMYRKKAV